MSFRNIYQDKDKDEEKLAKVDSNVKKHINELQLPGTSEERQTRLDNAAKSYLELRKWRYAKSSNLDIAKESLENLEKTLTANGYVLPSSVQTMNYYGLKSYNGSGWKLV